MASAKPCDCFRDPGVRRELLSWRWRLVYFLTVFYSAVALAHVLLGEDKSPLAPAKPPRVAQDQASSDGRVAPPTASAMVLSDAEVVTHFRLDGPRECERKGARLALGHLMRLRNEMADVKPPLVLGGIGDSGTRAVAYLVTQMGVWMGKFGLTVKKDSRDSKLFINGFETASCDASDQLQEQVIKSFIFYSRAIEACGSADYNRTCIQDVTVWNAGVQWTSTLFRTLLNHTKTFTARRSNRDKFPYGLWGYKHPRTTMILPYVSYVTSNRFKYLHIVRDGRDISAGDNTLFFNVCKKYYGADAICDDSYATRLELWSRLNLDVLAWANRNLAPEQFLVVRIEDLVKGQRACFDRIAAFTGAPAERTVPVVEQSIKLFTTKDSRYFGRKYTRAEQRLYTAAVRASPWARKAFAAYGYDVASWDTVGDCATMTFPVASATQ